MLKRFVIVLLMLFLIPGVSFAWTLNTWVKSGGGSIVVRGGATQTSVNGSVFKNYTTTQPFTVTVNPNTGYSISKITFNNVDRIFNSYSGLSPRSYAVRGPSSQSVYATFVAQLLSVTATVGPRGSVNLTSISNVFYGSKLSSAKSFTFTPNRSNISVIDISGVPAGAYVNPATPAAAGASVTVTLPAGYTFTSNVNLVGTFSSPPVAITAPPQVVTVGAPTTLDGSMSTGSPTTFSWSQVSGPASVVITNPDKAVATFTPIVQGTYYFSLTVNGNSTSITSVTVSNNLVTVERSQCQNCHASIGIGASSNVFANWSSSPHKSVPVICSQCHVGTNTGGHPGQLTGGSVNEFTFNYNAPFGTGNFCTTCHSPSIATDFADSTHPSGAASCGFCHSGGVHNPTAACVTCHNPGNSIGLTWPPNGWDFHNSYTGTNLCSNCHSLHNPGKVTGMSGAAHYNNITSAGYPASYMTSRATCANCHISNALNAMARHQWAKSGHAAYNDLPWKTYDFKTRSDCAQCHTTTGFIAYSTGTVTKAWGVASDKTKEVLTCVGCHSDVANGVVRVVTPVRPFANDSYVIWNVGPSNICMSCHSGTNNGLSITSSDFGNQAFIAPHYLAAGGILHGKGGYNFPGQTYAFYSSNTHRTIGMTNSHGTGTDGPCVTCHMSAPEKHRFNAVSSASNGTIGKITTGTCAKCHGNSLDDTIFINTQKTSFYNALDVINKALAYRGFTYIPTYPYFTNTDWTYYSNGGANTMGAAFNYVLLLKEPGAYAHNAAYTKQLVFDSIDFLYNGSFSGSIDDALVHLVGNGITQTQANSLKAYLNSSSCTSCHANTSGSHTAHLNSGISCEVCHSTTAASKTTLVSGAISHMNGVTDINFKDQGPAYKAGWPSPSYNSTTKTCSNVACHGVSAGTYSYYFQGGDGEPVLNTVNYGAVGSSTPAWNGTPSNDSCTVCHGSPPYDVPNQYLWHSGYHGGQGPTGANNQCQFCHPDAIGVDGKGTNITNYALHANGIVDVQASFKSSCFGCH